MAISENQKRKIIQVINVFETGTITGNYSKISIFSDGPVINGNRIKQITYGRSQTTEYGVLKILIEQYITNKGQFADQFKPFVDKIGKQPSLCTDSSFKSLLKNAGQNDSIMKSTQDNFFDQLYYQPAFNWFTSMKFTLPLSLLVIYDSFIHSGSILPFLRQRFPESVPANGGDEKKWINQYIAARHDWLEHHPNKILRNTVYRPICFEKAIAQNNWDLSSAIDANGTIVSLAVKT
jgi:chitosanase